MATWSAGRPNSRRRRPPQCRCATAVAHGHPRRRATTLSANISDDSAGAPPNSYDRRLDAGYDVSADGNTSLDAPARHHLKQTVRPRSAPIAITVVGASPCACIARGAARGHRNFRARLRCQSGRQQRHRAAYCRGTNKRVCSERRPSVSRRSAPRTPALCREPVQPLHLVLLAHGSPYPSHSALATTNAGNGQDEREVSDAKPSQREGRRSWVV